MHGPSRRTLYVLRTPDGEKARFERCVLLSERRTVFHYPGTVGMLGTT